MGKRILSLLLSCVLVFTSVTTVSYAEEMPQYILEHKNVHVDDVFSMDIMITDNLGIISLRFSVEYDKEKLQLLEITDNGLLRGYTTPSPNITSPYTLRWADSLAISNNYVNGRIATLKFRALSTGVASVTVRHEEARDFTGKKVVFANASSDVSITSSIPVTGLSFNESNVTVEKGDRTFALCPVFTPPNATNKNVSWRSSDDTIAMVDNGIVSLLKKGEVVITAVSEDGGFEATCTLHILCSHLIVNDIPAVRSTCITQGHGSYTVCEECGEIINGSDMLLPFAEHELIEDPKPQYLKSAATCVSPAVYYRSCAVCAAQSDMTFIYGTVDYDNHVGDSHLEYQEDPSCSNPGYTGDVFCDSCGEVITAGSEIETIAHTSGAPIKENEIIASCDFAGGYDEVVYCLVCGEEISREHKVVLATGHDWDEGEITTPATCTEDGIQTYTCQNDDSHIYEEAVPATGHIPSESVRENEVASTCATEGYYDEVIYCSVCGEELGRERKVIPVDDAAHNWGEWVRTKVPTEYEPGEETRSCKHNPSHKEARVIPVLDPSQLMSISVITKPTKLTYLEGKDTFDVTGGKIRLYYIDDISYEIGMTSGMVTGFDNTKVGKQTLTVTYNGKITTYEVEVIAKSLSSITVTTNPNKLVYSEGDEFDPTGMVVTAYYNNGTSKVIQTGLTISCDLSTPGSKTVTIQYEGKSTSINVQVNACVPEDVTSDEYSISDGYISKITAGVTVNDFLQNINESEHIKVFKGNNEVTSGTILGTGMQVKIMNGNNVVNSYTVVVTGDINGDGASSITDFVNMKSYMLGTMELAGAFSEAADLNGDGNITMTDFVRFKAVMLGTENIVPH
jgi:hypothetical protein